MLKIKIPAQELWDETTNEFIDFPGITISLEHSLVSISKWESKYHKPYLSKNKNDKSQEEIIDYIKMMTLTQNVPDVAYRCLTKDNLESIKTYLEDSMTATTIKSDPNAKKDNRVVTSELVYAWMISLNIPFECQKWHFNRLMMLIRVCNITNNPKQGKQRKRSRQEFLAERSALNAQRKAALKSSG